MNWKRALTWVIAVAFIVGLVFFLFEALGSEVSPAQLVMDTITLYSTADVVERASLITAMDSAVNGLENDAILAQWNTLTDCIAGNACSQDDYFDFIMMVSLEKRKEIPNSELIVNVVTANRYWGDPEKIIEFSKALSDANSQIEALQLKTVRNKWQEIVYCDGKCPEFHQSFFEFIRLLLSV